MEHCNCRNGAGTDSMPAFFPHYAEEHSRRFDRWSCKINEIRETEGEYDRWEYFIIKDTVLYSK